MLRIMFPDMHDRLPYSFGKAIEGYGELLLPDGSFTNIIKYWRKWDHCQVETHIGLSNVKSISYEEFQRNPPDIVICSCKEVEADVFALKSTAKIVHYSGNANTPFDFSKVKHIFTTDELSYRNGLQNGSNTILYYPYVDYDRLKYSGTADDHKIGTYIFNYKRDWKNEFELYSKLVVEERRFDFYEIANLSYELVLQYMRNSMATLHIKHSEGYGFAIIESLALGRPLILKREWVRNHAYRHWCIEHESAMFFSSDQEFHDLLRMLDLNEEKRYHMQKRSAEIIREKINNDEQSEKLKRFLEGIA